MKVADASVVAPALLDDGRSGANARDALAGRGSLHAPQLIHSEALSHARRSVRADATQTVLATIGLELLGTLPLTIHDHAPLTPPAWELRDRCSAYDAFYVALARALGATLLTADRRLARAVDGICDVTLVHASD